MKIIFITGSHPRHQYMARSIHSTGHLACVISESREEHVPLAPANLDAETTALFTLHFHRRAASEARFFDAAGWPDVPVVPVERAGLNGADTRELLRRETPDLLLSYGCHMLDDETLALVKGECWNIHGGLSPWYRGCITHFWPSYLLEPQMTGMTIHELTRKLDAGNVVHQCAAPLVSGDGLHDLSCRAVTQTASELPELIRLLAQGTPLPRHAHTSSGRLWTSQDWRPELLHMIYRTYGDRIVDRYLAGDWQRRAPQLHRQFDQVGQVDGG